jgi:hypothetical protein
LTQSTNLLQIFLDKGLTHDANHFIPEQTEIEIKPWRLWTGLVKVPHFWEDDIACLCNDNTPMPELIKRPGLRVFNFHPIHVFLNTENLERYESTRPIHRAPTELIQQRFTGIGARSQLLQLLTEEAAQI